MSNDTFKRLIFLLFGIATVLMVLLFTSGCNIQPTEQPKEESPTMVGLYPSPFDALTNGNMSCKSYIMTFKGESYIYSTDPSVSVSSYVSPCQMEFLKKQPAELRALVADMTTSNTVDEPRLSVGALDDSDGHTLIQLRNDKMNVDLFLSNGVKSMLPRSTKFNTNVYDRQKLEQTIPDYADQLAQKLVKAGYKFNDAKSGELQFENGSLDSATGYNTAVIFFVPVVK